MTRRLIVTADDFGLALPVNEAVERGHREGILTAASLMVTGAAAADAVERARRLPRLAVGLHLVLVDGKPCLAPEQVPDLVGPDGRFPPGEIGAGVRLFLKPAAQHQAEAEIRAQLDAFGATGLALDHVNAHHHFHLHPTVLAILLRLAPEYGIRAVRVPEEPFGPGRRANPERVGARAFARLFHAARTRRMKARLREAGIAFNDHIFGFHDSGHMTADRVRRYVENLPDGVSEIYLHPAASSLSGDGVPPPSYEGMAELAALLDRDVAGAVATIGAERIAFAAI